MTRPVYILTCSLPAAQMTAELSRLTGILLQAPYAFLQTFHQAGHAEIDIFDTQQQLLLRVALQPEDTLQGPVTLTAPPQPQTDLTPATLSLVQALTRLWVPAAVPGL